MGFLVVVWRARCFKGVIVSLFEYFLPCGGRDKLQEVRLGSVFSLWILVVVGTTPKVPKLEFLC